MAAQQFNRRERRWFGRFGPTTPHYPNEWFVTFEGATPRSVYWQNIAEKRPSGHLVVECLNRYIVGTL